MKMTSLFGKTDTPAASTLVSLATASPRVTFCISSSSSSGVFSGKVAAVASCFCHNLKGRKLLEVGKMNQQDLRTQILLIRLQCKVNFLLNAKFRRHTLC